MAKKVRAVFNRKKTATETVAASIEIVVCLQRERTYFSTDIKVTVEQWKGGFVVNHPKAASLNGKIQKQIDDFEDIITAMRVLGKPMTISKFRDQIDCKKPNRISFLVWMQERINARNLRIGTKRGHITTLLALERFGKIKSFDDLTRGNIYAFDLFLKEENATTTTGKPITRSQAAIHNYHKRLKSYVNEAYRLEMIKDNPYDKFVDKRGETAKRPHLTKEQIYKLLELRENCKNPESCKYIDFFLVQIFTGMAYSDAKAFEYDKHVVEVDGELFIDGKRIKTGSTFFTPILPITMDVLKRNNFKIEVISNQKFNAFLKGIGMAIGCNFPLSSHMARHTFAITVTGDLGVPREIIQRMLGHSSIKTTEIYARTSNSLVSNCLKKTVFDIWK